MARVFLSFMAVLAMVVGGVMLILGFTEVTKIVAGGAVMVCGAIIALAGVVIAAAITLYEEQSRTTMALEEIAQNVTESKTIIGSCAKTSREIIQEIRDIQGDSLMLDEHFKRLAELAARHNQLLEWTGEIQGETLRFLKKEGKPQPQEQT